jgi:predicted ATPase with chaperone activity
MSPVATPVASAAPELSGAAAAVPPVPESLRDTGLTASFVGDLLLKTLYNLGPRSGTQLGEALCLPYRVLDDMMVEFQQRSFVALRGPGQHSRASYIFDLTAAGRERAQEALEASRYVGPAPVPLEQYRDCVERQSVHQVHLSREHIRQGFDALVLSDSFLARIGPAVSSARSLFLFGAAGNGKTLIAETIASIMGGTIYVPHAILVEGQVIAVHDPVYHRAPDSDVISDGAAGSLWRSDTTGRDLRFIAARRPVVLTGGELTLQQLELRYDAHTRIYQAPVHVKANGGVLILDDFGRQHVEPRMLLNRWMIPLEQRKDLLTLQTGSKFPVPFDTLLIFATNLEPTHLVEESFLRRIRYKVHVDSPTREQYVEIFRRCCAQNALTFAEAAVDHIYNEWYARRGIPARACHPRDILDHVRDMAQYFGTERTLTAEVLDHACEAYFLTDPAAPQLDAEAHMNARPPAAAIPGPHG